MYRFTIFQLFDAQCGHFDGISLTVSIKKPLVLSTSKQESLRFLWSYSARVIHPCAIDSSDCFRAGLRASTIALEQWDQLFPESKYPINYYSKHKKQIRHPHWKFSSYDIYTTKHKQKSWCSVLKAARRDYDRKNSHLQSWQLYSLVLRLLTPHLNNVISCTSPLYQQLKNIFQQFRGLPVFTMVLA